MNALLAILRALPKERLRALEKFIRSPYHVTHEQIPVLYKNLLQQSAKERPDKSTLERQFETENAGKRLYHVTNYLMEAVERFLALERWEDQPHRRHADTVESLRRLRLPEPAAAMLRYARKRLSADALRGCDYHQADYRLHWEAYHLSLQQGRAKAYNAQELSDAQDIAFICDKLRMGCLLLSHQSVSRQPYEPGLLEPVLQFLDRHPYLQIPAVSAYYHGYFAQLGGPDSDEHFARLKALLQARAGVFSIAEMHDLFLMAINFCIRRINRLEEHYFQEIFDLYRSGLEHGALLEDGTLSRWTYNNITIIGLRLQEYDWVWRFLHEFAPLLPAEHREGTAHFNKARYHYEKGELQQAMQHLLHIEYDDVLQNLSAKVILCKIYFRLQEADALENQLDSIQIYLRRKKVLGYHRDNYLAFVQFCRKILTVLPGNAREKDRLRAEMEAAPVLTERDWLLSALAKQ